MNILILGSGGREHVFAQKIKESKWCDSLYIAPGNAGTAQCGINLNFESTNFEKIKEACIQYYIQLIVPGNEDPLVKGVVDFIESDPELNFVQVCGPNKAAAQIEGSKDFSKKLMVNNQIPTAQYVTVNKDNIELGYLFLEQLKAPYVLKADGLAAGKGVLILDDLEEAKKELKSMLDGKFGNAGNHVVIEEYLKGIELSCFVITDGNDYILLPEAKDYKRIGEGDTGLNTGGMGAVSPVPFADKEFMNKVEDRIIKPTIAGLKNMGINYTGFIFIGLMNVNGNPFVIEYNCRMGDPETEVVFPRIESDVVELFKHCCDGKINQYQLKVNPSTASTVFMVSGGYPEAFEKHHEIQNLEQVQNSMVFHAGTTVKDDKTITNGGRVLAITSFGNDIESSVNQSLNNAEIIQFKNKYFRKDIGKDLI